MFDLGFLELFICGVIALLVLGPERLPGAARAAGHWVGKARRMTRQFSEELDRQVKAEEIRERLKQEKSEIGYEDIQKNVQEALDEAKDHNHLVHSEDNQRKSNPGSGTSRTPTDSDSQSSNP
ncbi:Sec-independent protein translocase TatB [Halospina denitrificans]|uniref:Sec-independent protein translocase protein TatB n=1 Tax=Halospina denitrificans TaxID=332522 RepID=A0A4R7JPR6_9GAMM|nr:Sec-independent protein translocase protein TatB [Halospina denitrificans]TDT40151.1 Sec-independent protein translocase TatB [Halospina denitrificans]